MGVEKTEPNMKGDENSRRRVGGRSNLGEGELGQLQT